MDSSEAQIIATKFLDEIGEVMKGFKYGLNSKFEEFNDVFVFEYIYLKLDGRIPKNPPIAGGPRGVCINKKDKKVVFITYGDYFELVQSEKLINETYILFTQFQKNKDNLSYIKSRYNLTSKQLLDLSKLIENETINREQVLEFIERILPK